MAFTMSVEPDPQRGRGHALLILRGPVPEPFVPSLLIKRPGAGTNHLGPGGWQAAEHFWQPDVAATADGATLGLGPDIVRHMENGTYRIGVVDAPGQAATEATLVWRDIPGPLDLDSGAPGIRRRRGGVSITDPQRSTAADGVGSTAATETVTPARDTTAVVTPPKIEDPPKPDDDVVVPPRRPAWVWVALAVLLIGAAVGGYTFLKPHHGPGPQAQTDHGADKGRGGSPAAEQPALAQARQALRDPNLSADAAVTLAQKLAPAPNGADAAFLLWDYAASLGSAPAALALGGYYDPSRPAAGSIAKSGAQAVKWYRKAKAGGVAEADQRLAALRAWAGDAANANAPEAAPAMQALGQPESSGGTTP